MQQLLSAVAYCHARNVVHRYCCSQSNPVYSDLKPENLALESSDINGNIKVIDFGTSHIFEHRERMKEIMGTVRG